MKFVININLNDGRNDHEEVCCINGKIIFDILETDFSINKIQCMPSWVDKPYQSSVQTFSICVTVFIFNFLL